MFWQTFITYVVLLCTERENGAQHYALGNETDKTTEMQMMGNCIKTLRNKTLHSTYICWVMDELL